MQAKPTSASGVGLARSCAELAGGWVRARGTRGGVELMEAWLSGQAYRRHRHDTYAVCLTTRGLQAFDYRGAARLSAPGEVVVLHPDEPHDGRSGGEGGFGYQILYVDPGLVFEAVRAVCGRAAPLPFVPGGVVRSAALAGAVAGAFAGDLAGGGELALDSLAARLAEGLLAAAEPGAPAPVPLRLDAPALERARRLLDSAGGRAVRSAELEAAAGLSRYELARQFRRRYGTSPYRYLLMRRLDVARRLLAEGRPPADVALEAGFADQAHLTRAFAAAVGLTPARYRALRAAGGRGRHETRDTRHETR